VATRVKSEPAARPSNGETATLERASAPRRHRGPVSFPELVWAHFLWQQEVHEGEILHGRAEQDFQRLLAAFERRNGEIQNAYWCTREASAVAITAKRPYGPIGKLLRIHPVVRFHAVTHWITRDLPDAAGLLYRCEAMSVKFTELLRHGNQQIAMEWLLAIAGHVLGFVDQAEPPTKAETKDVVEEVQEELNELDRFYRRAGEAGGRIVFFWGMMLGVAVLTAIAAAGILLLDLMGDLDFDDTGQQNLFASYAMGAVGAVVSVLSRMAAGTKEKFKIDFEVGRPPIRRVASFRPFIGAVFALVLYFALRGDLVQLGTDAEGQEPLEYYAVLSFFAGFSERWVRGVLSPVAKLAGGGAEETGQSAETTTDAEAKPKSDRSRKETGGSG
jgi:hypothetical protein